MGSFIVFILKSSIGLIIFYLGYRWLLRKTTFYRINRLILLSIISLIPLLSVWNSNQTTALPLNIEADMVYSEYDVSALSFNYYAPSELGDISSSTVSEFPYAAFFVCIYLLGVIVMFIHFLGIHIYLLLLIKNSRHIKQEDGTILAIHSKKISPFSWMNYILISDKENEEELECILRHEKAHIDHFHTLDLFLAQGITILFWFNPAAWLLKKEIQKIDEYEADASVLSSGTDAKKYQLLLIKKAVGSQRFNSMTNSFNHSKLKVRITMMLKEKTPQRAFIRYLYLIPALVLMLAVFERPALAEQIDKFSEVEVSELISFFEMKLTERKDITSTENEELFEENNPLFVVNGKITNVDIPKDLDLILLLLERAIDTANEEDFGKLIGVKENDIVSIEVLKDEAAVNTYGEKAKNGVLYITTDTSKNQVPPPPPPIPPTKKTEAKPLIVWNGGICEVDVPANFSYEKDGNKETLAKLLKMKPEDIQSIKFIESEEATKRYGKKAVNGVVYVQTANDVKSEIKRIAPPPPPIPPKAPSPVVLKEGDKETVILANTIIFKFEGEPGYEIEEDNSYRTLIVKHENPFMHILKDSVAIAKYGEIGKEGLPIIDLNQK